jgi:hypothetical protein
MGSPAHEGYNPEPTNDMGEPPTITEIVETEALVPGLPEETYRRDPVPDGSISSTSIKIMVEQSPKHVREYLDNGRPPKRCFDLGSAVHSRILGGPEVVYWGKGEGRDTWQSNAAKAFYKEALDAGQIPLKLDEKQQVEDMVAAILRDPDLGAWLEPGGFDAELSEFWIDTDTGLWCRGRLDAATTDDEGRLIAVDLKTGHDVHPAAIAKAVANNRYDLQEAHYVAGLRHLMDIGAIPEADIRYVLAFVEKTPPYDVVLRTVGHRTGGHARIHRRHALDLFAECIASNAWPGYDRERADDDDIPEVEAPAWQLDRWDWQLRNDFFNLGDPDE